MQDATLAASKETMTRWMIAGAGRVGVGGAGVPAPDDRGPPRASGYVEATEVKVSSKTPGRVVARQRKASR